MKIKRFLHQMAALLCTAALISAVPSAAAMAKTAKKTVKASELQSGLQFTLTGMPYGGKSSPIPATYNGAKFEISTVQNFAFSPDNKYIFTVSEGRSSGKKHTILVCADLPASPGQDAEATFRGYKILDNYGHGETLAVTQSSVPGAYDVWVACTPGKTQNSLGKDIMRLTCQVETGSINIINEVKLSFNGVKPFGTNISRDRLGVAVNPASNQIAFRIHTTRHGSFYQIYNFGKLNKKLNSTSSKGTFRMSSKAAKKMLLTEIKCSLTPNGAFQSFDIDGQNLYICGGNRNKGAMIYKIKYSKKTKSQKLTSITQQIKITPSIKVTSKYSGITNRAFGKADLEIEGMKVVAAGKNKVNYYINFFMANVTIRDTIGIYKFTR